MRWLILFSIVLAQVRFRPLASRADCRRSVSSPRTPSLSYVPRLACCSPLTRSSQAQNLQAFVMAVSKCQTLIPLPYLIFVQLIVFLRASLLRCFPADPSPALAMIRSIQKLSGTALVADAFILFGLVYIFSTEVGVLAEHGLADVKAFNSKDFPLLIGYVSPSLLQRELTGAVRRCLRSRVSVS